MTACIFHHYDSFGGFSEFWDGFMRRMLVALSVVGLIIGCSSGDHKSESQGNKHWTYLGSEGPVHWGSLSDEFALCGTGREQSPINVVDEHKMNLAELEFDYHESAHSKIINNGHTIQVNYAAGSHAKIGGKKYDLLQLHFHL